MGKTGHVVSASMQTRMQTLRRHSKGFLERISIKSGSFVSGKEFYQSGTSNNMSRMHFQLPNFDQVEVNALDQGFTYMKALKPV
jgi:hypothetical protein